MIKLTNANGSPLYLKDSTKPSMITFNGKYTELWFPGKGGFYDWEINEFYKCVLVTESPDEVHNLYNPKKEDA